MMDDVKMTNAEMKATKVTENLTVLDLVTAFNNLMDSVAGGKSTLNGWGFSEEDEKLIFLAKNETVKNWMETL